VDLSEQKHLPAAPTAVFAPHPLMPAEGRELVYEAILPGESLEAFLARTGLLGRIGNAPVTLMLAGRYRIPREMWGKVYPNPGVMITIVAVAQGGGGGGGKNPLAAILSIAVMVFAPMIAPFLGITSQLGIGLLRLGLGLAINALFPPPKPQISQAQAKTQEQASPTYSLTGGQNRARPYEPMPLYVGKNLVFADLGAKTYTETSGEDQYLYQLFDFGYNDLVLTAPRIGTTPLSSYDGITVQDSTNGAITLFPANVDTVAGADLPHDVWQQRTSSAGVTRLAVEIVGQSYRLVSEDGGTYGNAYSFYLQYRPQGTTTWLDWFGSTSLVDGTAPNKIKTLRFTFYLDVAEGAYDVQVRFNNTTGDSYEGVTVIANFTWSQLRCYQPDKADYIGRQRRAIIFKASGQLSGQVEAYNNIASARTLVWNGASWVTAETSNPAWWVLAVARGKYVTKANGRVELEWGAGMPDSRIDIEGIKAFGAWCDAKALTFNGIFDQQQSAFEIMAAIALMGRGTLSWANGKLGVVWDAPDQPVVSVFTMSNIMLGSFEVAYQTEELADELVCSFINPELEWQRDTLRVTVPGVTNPVRVKNIELFGCTNKDLAARQANLYAAQNAYRTKRYKWHADWEGMACTRGDVVRLSHDLTSYDYSGRLVEGSTAAAPKLERLVPLAASGGWVVIIKPDQSFGLYQVAGGTGQSDTLTLVSPLGFDPGADPDHPPCDYKFLYGTSSSPGKLVKIDAMRPLDDSTVEITAIDEFPEYYACENNPYSYTPPRPRMGLPRLDNLALTVDGVRAGTGYLARVTATWNAQNDYSRAEIFLDDDGTGFRPIGQTDSNSFAFTLTDGLFITLRVVAYSSLGALGGKVIQEISQLVDFAGLRRPADVSSFVINGQQLAWSAVADVDVLGYEIRFHYGDYRSWEDAVPMHAGLITDNPWSMPASLPGTVTIMIKAQDAAGLQSANPAIIVTDLGDPAVANVLVTQDYAAAGFPGTISGGSVSGGALRATNVTLFYGNSDALPLYGPNDGAPFYAPALYAAMTYEAQNYSPAAVLTGSLMTLDFSIAADPYFIEYRITGAAPLYSTTPADPFYGPDDSMAFYAPAGDYAAWPGQIAVTRQPYDFRVRTSQGPTQGVLSAFSVIVDAPDIEQQVNDLAIGSGGTRVTLTEPFTEVSNIQITLEDDGGSAVTARYVDKSIALGPLIKCFNAAGSAVAGTVDVRLKGY
jgi:hypothetical protein